MYTLAVFVGSLRKDSINKKLAENLMRISADLFQSTLVPLADIPMFNQDMEENLPAPVQRLKAAVKAADAILFVSPEYNRGIPPLMKNVLDWGSRPYGQNSWINKPAAVCGISPSPVGTAVAQSHLRSVITILNMALISQPEVYLTDDGAVFDASGKIAAERTEKYLRGFMERFEKWIRCQQQM